MGEAQGPDGPTSEPPEPPGPGKPVPPAGAPVPPAGEPESPAAEEPPAEPESPVDEERPAEPEPPADEEPPRPTAPWYGAIASLALLLSALWLLSYTLLDWDWQQRLRGWNYVVALVLSAVPGRMLQHWHGEPHRE